MKVRRMNYGFRASQLDGTETILKGGAYETLPVPKAYSYIRLMSPVLNQGQESTCVPHAVSAAYDWYNAMHRDSIGQFTNAGISVHQIYEARTNSGEGMAYREALEFCKTHGVISEDAWRTGKKEEPSKITDYALIGSIDVMKRSLIINGPCMVATYVRDMYRTDYWNGDRNWGGHAVSFIGYDDNIGAFILRNSWGTDYGDRGYSWFPYSDYNKILEAWTVIA